MTNIDTSLEEHPQLQLTQFIEAPLSSVFAAWTNPELIKQWFAPGEMTVPLADASAEPGGSYRIQMKNSKDETFTTHGEYLEVVTDEKLVFTWGWEGPERHESLVTVEFLEKDGGTEINLTHTRFVTDEQAELHLEGWTGCLANLANRIGSFTQ